MTNQEIEDSLNEIELIETQRIQNTTDWQQKSADFKKGYDKINSDLALQAKTEFDKINAWAQTMKSGDDIFVQTNSGLKKIIIVKNPNGNIPQIQIYQNTLKLIGI